MSFSNNKREIELLLIGQEMLEASIAIQNHVSRKDKTDVYSIGDEAIKFIAGAEVYGEAILINDKKRREYKTALDRTRKDLEICIVGTTNEVVKVAARLAAASINDSKTIAKSRVIDYLGSAVACCAELINKLKTGEALDEVKITAKKIFNKVRDAIKLAIDEIERVSPAVKYDSEWSVLREKVILKTLFGDKIAEAEAMAADTVEKTSILDKVSSKIKFSPNKFIPNKASSKKGVTPVVQVEC